MFKVSQLLKEGSLKALAVVIAVLSVTYLAPYLAVLTVGLPIAELVMVVFKSWERLEDPQERDVFEAVFKLQGKFSVVNHEAYERENFANAYGRTKPTIEEIEKEMSSRMSSQELRSMLIALKQRDILEEHDGRWSVKL